MTITFEPNETFDRIFLLKGIDERRTKAGKPYLTVILGTSEGTWDGRVWDMEMSSLPGFLEGDPVQVKGSAQRYQEKIQLIVEEISKVAQPVDPRSIYPSTSASEKQLREDFNHFVEGIEEPALKTLMEAMLQDRKISDAFFTCPAAISMHHARIGGLAEHSLNVCRLAHAAVAVAPWLHRGLLTAGALLHDIGKVLEYEVAGDFRYTLEGKFQGHIVKGHSVVEKWISRIPDFPERLALDVLHILLSHHGQLEFGSPKTPVTAEALVVHFADDLDAKLDMVKSAGEEPGTEEAFVRGLRRSFLYRNDRPDTETRRPGDTENGGEEQEQGAGRRAQGEEDQDTGTRGRGDTGKSDGQEELF
ncbi:MAG: HD domain-containing protein [bacterium]|nr:HD domain-containing protein [bacterium]MDT8365326.1 HD domain-containing protein [bacterium]